jgi:hypothetical protein
MVERHGDRSNGCSLLVDNRYTLLRHHLRPTVLAPQQGQFWYPVVMALIWRAVLDNPGA